MITEKSQTSFFGLFLAAVLIAAIALVNILLA